MVKKTIITTIIAIAMTTLTGCYKVQFSLKKTYDTNISVGIFPSAVKSWKNEFMGDEVKSPYGYKNMCRWYMTHAKGELLDEYDVMAFYSFCNREKLCKDANRKNSRFYDDHVFSDLYCKNDYITWEPKESRESLNQKYLSEAILEGTKNNKGLREVTMAHKWLQDNFFYLSDEEQFPNAPHGVYDVWFVNTDRQTIGDCEDFALKLIWILKDVLEIDKDRLFLIGAFAYTGEGHELPNYLDDNGILWQLDNMLDAPMPAYYAYKALGAKSDARRGLGEIMRLDKAGYWYEFHDDKLKNPDKNCDN